MKYIAIGSSRSNRDARDRHGRCAAGWRRLSLGVAASVLAAGAPSAPAPRRRRRRPTPAPTSISIRSATSRDRRSTSCSGINNSGVIAGYFGSGEKGHPNRGYVVTPGYGQGNFHNENFPGAAQTQVIGINNHGDTAGFWVDAQRRQPWLLRSARAQAPDGRLPDQRQRQARRSTSCSAINDAEVAVGFYTDGKGTNHGFAYNIAAHRFKTDQRQRRHQRHRRRDQQRERRRRLRHQLRGHDRGLSCCAPTASCTASTSRAPAPPRRSASTTATRSSAPTPSAPATTPPRTGSSGRRASASRPSTTPTASDRRRSTASTTGARSWASTPTRRRQHRRAAGQGAPTEPRGAVVVRVAGPLHRGSVTRSSPGRHAPRLTAGAGTRSWLAGASVASRR